jgi:hypothetical protein
MVHGCRQCEIEQELRRLLAPSGSYKPTLLVASWPSHGTLILESPYPSLKSYMNTAFSDYPVSPISLNRTEVSGVL